jgi:hypothetical protein
MLPWIVFYLLPLSSYALTTLEQAKQLAAEGCHIDFTKGFDTVYSRVRATQVSPGCAAALAVAFPQQPVAWLLLGQTVSTENNAADFIAQSKVVGAQLGFTSAYLLGPFPIGYAILVAEILWAKPVLNFIFDCILQQG